MSAGIEGVTLLFGSPSSERRVSVASAQFVSSHLSARTWFWTAQGSVVEVSREELEAHREPFTADFDPTGSRRWPDLQSCFATLTESEVLLLAVHGGDGENGALQRELEARRVAFTGSGSRASALAFDKTLAIALASQNGIRTARGCSLPPCAPEQVRETIAKAFADLGPMVVKPNAGGSSLLLCFVRTLEDIDGASAVVAQHAEVDFRVEQLINGREFTVGVIETEAGEHALPCSEVVMQGGRTFDYEGKYLGAGSIEITPAQVPPEVREALQQVALTMHRGLGCQGYSRTDLLLNHNGPVYLETNTLPGLSARSFIPQQLEAAGIPFAQFLQAQLQLALRRTRPE